MTIKVYWAEGFDLDANAPSFGTRYRYANPSGTFFVAGRTGGQALSTTSTSNWFSNPDNLHPLTSVQSGPSFSSLLTAWNAGYKLFGVSFWLYGGAQPISCPSMGWYFATSTQQNRTGAVFSISGSTLTLTSTSWFNSTTVPVNATITPWTGWKHFEVNYYVTYVSSNQTYTSTVKLYADGNLLASTGQDSIPSVADGISLCANLNTIRNCVMDSVVFYTGDTLNETVGPLEVSGLVPNGTISNGTWLNSDSTATGLHNYVNGADLTATDRYIQTNDVTSAQFGLPSLFTSSILAAVYTLRATSVDMQASMSLGGTVLANLTAAGLSQGLVSSITSLDSIVIGTASPQGQVLYQNTGGSSATYSWIVPGGVTSVSVVAISEGSIGTYSSGPGFSGVGTGGYGGGLGYSNNITVTPGETLTIQIDAPYVGDGGSIPGNTSLLRSGTVLISVNNATNTLAGGKSGTAQIMYSGGAPGDPKATTLSVGLYGATGSGGAAGYAGNGGNGGIVSTTASNMISSAGAVNSGAGGGGGGKSQSASLATSYNGGGVSPNGIGTTGGTSLGNGLAGSGGAAYIYGGGVGASIFPRACIRIIWGDGRSFPSNAGDV